MSGLPSDAPQTASVAPVAIRIVYSGDLTRSRLTVFFRLLLAVPHLLWLMGWTIVAVPAILVNWVITLFRATGADPLHRFLGAYVRYQVHLFAFVLLAASPFPGFLGRPGTYPVDLEIDAPVPQNRWRTGFRSILAVPASILCGALLGSVSVSSIAGSYSYGSLGLAATAGALAWWACIFTARMPSGLGNVVVYGLGYVAQANAYLFLLTDRYPNSDPYALPAIAEWRRQPIGVTLADDGRRSRLTVFFRLVLVLPHIIWWYGWALIAQLFAFLNWLITLITGRSPDFFHNFLGAFVRYQSRLHAYLSLVTDPYPTFLGRPGDYPLEVQIALPSLHQNRWRTLFRFVLAFPAWLLLLGVLGAQFAVALLGWWACVFTGRMPTGLRNLGLYCLRYQAQVSAYSYFLLTETYPYSGPACGPPPVSPPGAAQAPAAVPSATAPATVATPGARPADPTGPTGP